MAKLLNMETRPYYAQVALFDPTVEDSYPDWGTGSEEAVLGATGIAVATGPDNRVEVVAIEVWTAALEELPNHRVVLEGDFTVVGDGGVVVGSVVGNDLHPIALSAGLHRVLVYVHGGRGAVDAVSFVLDPAVSPTL